MNQKIISYIDNIFQIAFIGLVLAIPFFFWNLTSEFYETPKFLILSFITLFLLGLWVIKFVVAGKVTIKKSAIDIPMLLLVLAFIVSTFFSSARWISITGSLPKIHGGMASFIIYVILYFLLVSNLKKISFIKQLLYLLLGSGVILSLLSLLSYFGINIIPLPFTQIANFTPTGSSFSTNAILVMLIPILLVSILYDLKGDVVSEQLVSSVKTKSLSIAKNVIYSLLLALFAATIILTGSWTVIVPGLLAAGLVLLITPQPAVQKNLPYLIIPAVLAAILFLASTFALGGSQNPLYNKAQNFPKEIQLPFITSWKISVSAFRDSPFWGSGPATFLSSFTAYKPIEFNSTKFWDIRFDTAFNEYFQFLANLGAPGLIVLLLLTAVFISQSFKTLTSHKNPLSTSLGVSGIAFFTLLALHPSTLVVWVVGLIILASFMVVHKDTSEEIQIGIAAAPMNSASGDDKLSYLRFDALPTLLLLITLIIVVGGFYFVGKFSVADYYHRLALNSVAKGQGLDAYNQLIKAEILNPYTDLYRIDLAQTNFALANAIALSKGPTEASPEGSLTDEDKQNIQTLLGQAISEGRVAVALNPHNAGNWEILGSIYRQISGVAENALGFALDSYGQAISKDPLNPLLRLSTGGIYYSIRNYDMAIRFFTDAINLKPDYANAYYNLSIALRDKGDIESAVIIAEKTVSLLEPESPDYKAASELLSQLKDKISTESAQADDAQEKVTTTSAPEKSALENKNLPKVLDLPEVEEIATPPAVKTTEEE